MTAHRLTSAGLPATSHNAYSSGAQSPHPAQVGGFGDSRTAEEQGSDSRPNSGHQRLVEPAQLQPEACQPVSLGDASVLDSSRADPSCAAVSEVSAVQDRPAVVLEDALPGKQSEALLHDKLSLVRQLPTPAMESVPTVGKPRGFEGQRQAKGYSLSLTPQSRPEKAEELDPAALRSSLEAYYQLLDACDALPPEGGLQGLIAKRVVRADLVAAIDTVRRKLSRIARHGGRGFAPQKAVSP